MAASKRPADRRVPVATADMTSPAGPMDAASSDATRIFLGVFGTRKRVRHEPYAFAWNQERPTGSRRQSVPELADGDAQRTDDLEHQAEIEQAPRRQGAATHRRKDAERHDHGPQAEQVRDAEVG